LREISGDTITLERVKNVAGALPVIGNIMSAVDVLGDIIELIRDKSGQAIKQVLTWVSLGINLIGMVPFPPTMAAAKMGLRPILHLAKQRLAHASVGELGDAFVELIAGHVSATMAGEIDTYIEKAQASLNGLLSDAAAHGKRVAEDWAAGLEKLSRGELFDSDGDRKAASAQLKAAWETPFLNDPKAKIGNYFGALWSAYKSANKAVANKAAGKAMDAGAGRLVRSAATSLRNLGSLVNGKLLALANPGTLYSIGWILQQIAKAVKAWRGRKKAQGRPGNAPGAADKKNPQDQLGAIKNQNKTKQEPNPGKCPREITTKKSIGFALGNEMLVHTDFELSGSFPLVWTRFYNSRLGAYDGGSLGARWISPWTVRIDIGESGFVYHGPDGRSHECPRVLPGQRHRNAIEGFTLIPLDDRLIQLSHKESEEFYERVEAAGGLPAHYRLARTAFRGGVEIGLCYERRTADGRGILSDVLVRQGEEIVHHVSTRIDEAGRIREIWQMRDGEAKRQVARYEYAAHADGTGDLVIAQDENGAHWEYRYDHHLVTRYVDRSGRGMNLEWDGAGPEARAYHEWADDGSYETRLQWDPNIRCTYITDAEGGVTLHYCDILGYAYRMLHADGGEEWFFRDERKNIVRHLHPDGSQDFYTWDERDNLLSHTRADGGTAYFEYDGEDNLVGIQDAEGGVWKREYDGRGNLTAETDPLGNRTEYEYNQQNLLIGLTDAKGGKKGLAYTERGQLKTYTDCSGKTTSWEYDERDRVVSESNAAGETTKYGYGGIVTANPEAADREAEQKRVWHWRQNAGQLEAVIHPDGSKEHFLHDAEGRLLAHTDPLGRVTAWKYTAAGLIGTRRDALGHTLRYGWDKLGRLTALQNENGATAEFRYDPVGRLLEEKGFDGKKSEYRYEPSSGRLASLREGEAQSEFEFDAAGRLEKRKSGKVTPDGQWNLESEEEYHWDRNGRLLAARNETSRLRWFYDEAGNLKTEQQEYPGTGRTAVWRHEYDALGNRVFTLRPDGHKIERMSYGAGHVHGMLLDGEEVISFERDDLHRETERRLRNGLTHSQAYDPAGRLKEQVLAHSPGGEALNRTTTQGGQLFKRAYAYDRAGQLTGITDSKGERNYRYDPVGRLTEALSPLGSEKFAFDPANNLIDTNVREIAREEQSGLALDTEKRRQSKLLDNLLRDYAGTHYRYDERGNLTEKIKNGAITRYQWNAQNQLTKVETAETVTQFAYDPLGRRIIKHSQPVVARQFNAGSRYHQQEAERLTREQELGTTFYGWDGDTLAWETTNEQSTHYFYEPDSFVPIAQGVQNRPMQLHQTPDWSDRDYRVEEDPLWTQILEPQPFDKLGFYHCDHLGTPQEITDEDGNIAWQAQYKAWGEAKEVIGKAATKAGFKNPLRFQGQYFDHETGLHYNRYRYYDPEIGRFISKDPIGFAGGLNRHQYAPNSTE
jgi:RHS repeat-associated protein